MDPAPAVAAELWRPPHLAAGGGRAVEATSAVTEKSSGGRGGGGAGRRRQRETPASEDDSSRIVSTSGGGGGQDLVGSLSLSLVLIRVALGLLGPMGLQGGNWKVSRANCSIII